MRLLKKCDANDRMPASLRNGQHLFGPVRQAKASASKPLGSWASGLTFVEDFTLEHSFPGLQIPSIEILGSF